MGKVMVVAGEVSGDIQAARVVREIKRLSPHISFSGMGSKQLKEEGVEIILDPTQVSTIGFLEALKNIRIHLSHLKLLKEHIKREEPDVIFLVDYSGFNMMMARIARKMGIPAVNYFSPSAWIWGRWRAGWMARNRAAIASVFPMEDELYREVGAEVHFVGHPLVDLVKPGSTREETISRLELDPEKPIIGLLPGSRNQEIETLLPEMLKAAEAIQKERPEYQFVLPLASGIEKAKVAGMASNYNLIIKLVENLTYDVMNIADLLITASGTATLEAALLGTPMVIVYKISPTTYRLAKKLVQTDYIGMPNIIGEREIVPELIQERANWKEIYDKVLYLLDKPYLLKNMKRDLEKVGERLGEPGALKRTAKLVLEKGGLL